jgi:predicted acyltransferase
MLAVPACIFSAVAYMVFMQTSTIFVVNCWGQKSSQGVILVVKFFELTGLNAHSVAGFCLHINMVRVVLVSDTTTLARTAVEIRIGSQHCSRQKSSMINCHIVLGIV